MNNKILTVDDQKLEANISQEQNKRCAKVKELTQPENLIGHFSSTNEMFEHLLADDED